MSILKKKARRSAQSKIHSNSNITSETRQESYVRRPVRANEILAIMGDREMTARQIMQESKYSDMNCIRPRLSELKDDGKIEVVGKAYDFATERNVALFRVKED